MDGMLKRRNSRGSLGTHHTGRQSWMAGFESGQHTKIIELDRMGSGGGCWTQCSSPQTLFFCGVISHPPFKSIFACSPLLHWSPSLSQPGVLCLCFSKISLHPHFLQQAFPTAHHWASSSLFTTCTPHHHLSCFLPRFQASGAGTLPSLEPHSV